jgi:hypothetical protein
MKLPNSSETVNLPDLTASHVREEWFSKWIVIFMLVLYSLFKFSIPKVLPPLWSSGKSSWLQNQGSGFDSRRYQIFWVVVGLERGPLSLVSTNEELLERKNSGSGLESREYGRRGPSRWPRGTVYPQKLALTSPTILGRHSSLADSVHGV